MPPARLRQPIPAARRERSPLQWGRVVFLVLGLLSMLPVAVAVAAGAPEAAVPAPVGLAGVAVLAACWAAAVRRGRFELWLEPAEWTALALVALGAGAERATGLFFGGLFLRALFLGAPRLAVSTLAYVAVWSVTSAAGADPAVVFASLPRSAALVLTAAGMHLFAGTLRRYERAMARERELVEEVERRRGEERFRSLVQASSDLLLVVDDDGLMTFRSPSAERVLGPASAPGEPFAALVHPDDDGPLAGGAVAPLAGRGALPWRGLRPDGTAIELEGVVSDLRADATVGGFVVSSRDVGERNAAERALAHRAYHDVLTGLPNRARLLERLTEAVDGGAAPAVLQLELDELGAVTDSLGHGAGDDLLRTAATRLLEVRDPDDLVARLGDTFVLVRRSGAGGDAALAALADEVAEALGAPYTLEGREVRTGVSIGIARGEGHLDAGALLRDADTALHAARGSGTRKLFTPAMRAAADERVALRAELERALERGELVLHFQPTVDLPTGQVTGAEALVRWRHPERGLVPPGAFIPIAEETGLVVALGRWVLREACRQLRAWNDAALPGAAPLTVSVNVSVRQLHDPGLVADVAAALRDAGVAPRQVVLEITESALAEHTEVATERLGALRALGVRIAIDDFGTGYSSLRYLQQFPLDVLKVDRSFVADLDGVGGDETLARVVLDLARALGLRTIGEGIEREGQLDVLRRLGCEVGQGFLFSAGLPPAEFTALLARDVAETVEAVAA